MLSLVAYDSSECSDSENEDDSSKFKETNETSENSGSVEVIPILNNTHHDKTANIFVALPKPQTSAVEAVEEEQDEYLNKKEIATEKPKKHPVKITVPSLSEFEEDDEETPAKKPKLNSKACGLFSLLPPPKTVEITAKHFIPNSVTRNMNKSANAINKIKSASMPTKKTQKKEHITGDAAQSDDEDVFKNLPDTFDDETWQKVCGRQEKRVPKPIIKETPEISFSVIQPDPEVTKPYEGLDNKAFKELMGANNKRKGDIIDIIDINEDEILSDKDIWMTKSLTDPEMAPKYEIKNPVNDTCRRKHHITYLAQQAKANEQELQNQWASSRFTRQKTQAKYGF